IDDFVERTRGLITLLGPGDRDTPCEWRSLATGRVREMIMSTKDPRLLLDALACFADLLSPGGLWRRAEAIWGRVEAGAAGPEAPSFFNVVYAPLGDAPPAAARERAGRIPVPSLRADLLTRLSYVVRPEEHEAVVEDALSAALAVETPRRKAELLVPLLF